MKCLLNKLWKLLKVIDVVHQFFINHYFWYEITFLDNNNIKYLKWWNIWLRFCAYYYQYLVKNVSSYIKQCVFKNKPKLCNIITGNLKNNKKNHFWLTVSFSIVPMQKIGMTTRSLFSALLPPWVQKTYKVKYKYKPFW